MPNWVNNEVHMRNIGFNKKLYNDSNQFDFNSIIPMPESIMDTDAGGITNIAIELVLYLADKRYEIYSYIPGRIFGAEISDFDLLDQNPELKDRVLNALKWQKASTNEEAFAALIKMGVQYIYNMCRYGHPEWYDWSCRNWSTKWNASETKVIDNDCISFNTPWNIPDKVFIALSEMYPYDEIIVNWWEESGYCGIASYHGGEKIQDDCYHAIWDTIYDYEKDEYKNRLFTVVKPEE